MRSRTMKKKQTLTHHKKMVFGLFWYATDKKLVSATFFGGENAVIQTISIIPHIEMSMWIEHKTHCEMETVVVFSTNFPSSAMLNNF